MRRFARTETLSELGPVIARAAAIVAVLVVTIVAAIIVTRPYGNYEVNAVFDDTRGLIEGGKVTAGFQQIGSVEEITLGEDGLPLVTMQIDGDFKLHQGAFADVRLTSNVGAINRVVDLTQGDLDAPELSDGDTLGPSSTDQPVDLDAAVATLDPKTRAEAAKLLAGLDRATVGRGPDLNETLQYSSRALNETANLLANANADGEALRSLLADTSTVVGALAQSPGELGAAAERTATLLSITGARQAELRRSVEAIGPALASGRLTLERLEAAVPDLRGLVVEGLPLLRRLRPVARALPPTIKHLRPVLAQTRKLIRTAPKDAKRLQPLLADAIPLLRELDPTLSQLNPALDHLRAKGPEVVGFFQLGADAIANYDVNGHMIRFSAIPIQFPRHPNLTGPSENVAGSLVPPFDRTPGMLEGEPWEDYAQSFIGGASP